MKKIVLVLFAIGLLSGCKTDPYEGQPAVVAELPPEEKPAPTEVPEVPVQPIEQKPTGFTFNAPDVLSFTEGVIGEYKIQAIVPYPGAVQLQFVGLPTGMTFDPVSSKLTWIPGPTDANDPAKPELTQKTLVIEAHLSSSKDPISVLVKKIVVLVNDDPGSLKFTSSLELKSQAEGVRIGHSVSWADTGFPQGPFQVIIEGFPDGVALMKQGANQVQLSYTPPFNLVKDSTPKNVEGTISVINPQGRRISGKISWEVLNQLGSPFLQGPANVRLPPSGGAFAISAEDVNGVAPVEWSVVGSLPKGKVKGFEQSQDNSVLGNPQTSYVVSWTEIPPSYVETKTNFSFKACTADGACSQHNVTVEVSSKSIMEPMAELRSLPGSLVSIRDLSRHLKAQIQNFEIEKETSKAAFVHQSNGQVFLFKKTDGCQSLFPISESASLAVQCFNTESQSFETHFGFDPALSAKGAL